MSARAYRFTLILGCISVVGLLVGSEQISAQTVAVKYSPSVFRSFEARFDDTKKFTKWISMLERKLEQQPDLDTKGCGFQPNEACGPYFWRNFVAEVRSEDSWSKVVKVNAYLNEFKYITDFVNWGVADFWETPLEFLEKSGDCEDYAIAKYVTLKKLGFDSDSMRIVALNDTNLRTGHAVLMLTYQDQIYILDNQSRTITVEKNIQHYQAVYSINEHHWWLHIYR